MARIISELTNLEFWVICEILMIVPENQMHYLKYRVILWN